jgi:hypothetical protein
VTAQQNYSRLDRLFHRVAFSSPAVQLTAADIEKSMYGRRFTAINVDRPVFITSLPRAGTTLMLELLGRLPAFATYTYRDMPFVLAPLLWESFSRGFRKPAQLTERAHGDGMAVGYDSPEAFEEVLWMTSWPEKFSDRGITPWSETETAPEFRELFVSQMQRIVAVRGNGNGPRRYLSKNNANIARIALLRRLFPNATVLVPFRRPMDQAGSLLRQHLRFLEMHAEDSFSRRYMEDIGHLEFGALHRPILFEGMTEVRERHDPKTIDYWLAYWNVAFRHILGHRDGIILVSYEQLCASGVAGVQAVARQLEVPAESLDALATVDLHQPRSHRPEALPADLTLLEEAEALYCELTACSQSGAAAGVQG